MIGGQLRTFEEAAQLITEDEAVHITALVGQKGPEYAACTPPFSGGSNVLSVAFAPASLTAYAAWEDGEGVGSAAGNWRPAACNGYLKMRLRPWFEGQPPVGL